MIDVIRVPNQHWRCDPIAPFAPCAPCYLVADNQPRLFAGPRGFAPTLCTLLPILLRSAAVFWCCARSIIPSAEQKHRR